jgi:exopolysaccharide/PEP-CTERM locus tyrosine autokinase
MSLVEQALKKLQASRGGVAPSAEPARVPAPAPAPARATSNTGDTARHAALAAPVPARSDRVVAIDRDALRSAGLMPSAEAERVVTQQFRQIKRPLVANAVGRGATALPNGHIIMLASALPGDGKTFTSLNLALSMALEKDVRVLLVDADVAKMHISRALGVAGEPGLLDVLRDQSVDIESVILNTDVPNLSILPAGKPTETATELLASSRMADIIARFGAADRQRIVLFDTPPLLLTTESRVLASSAGQVVLVIGAGSTPQKAVFDALDLLGEGKPVSLVLNQCDEGSDQGYYDYYGQQAENAGAS